MLGATFTVLYDPSDSTRMTQRILPEILTEIRPKPSIQSSNALGPGDALESIQRTGVFVSQRIQPPHLHLPPEDVEGICECLRYRTCQRAACKLAMRPGLPRRRDHASECLVRGEVDP